TDSGMNGIPSQLFSPGRLGAGRLSLFACTACLCWVAASGASADSTPPQPGPAPGGALDRTVLPIAEPMLASITELDARKAKAPPRFEVKAPAGAPNVVIVLIDDIGFGHSSAFGGGDPTPTPVAEGRGP